MEIRYRVFKRLFPYVLLIGIAVSCVNHEYDFDRTDRNVTLMGETISIPLGQIGPMNIQDIMGEQLGEYLVPLSDGTFSIQYKGNPVRFVFDELQKIDGAAPFSRFCDFPISYDLPLFTKPDNVVFDAKGEADLSGPDPLKIQLSSVTRSISSSISNLPKELASLKSITLTSKSRVEISLSIPDCPLISGTVTPDLRIDLGSLFESDDFPGGALTFNTPLDSKNAYTVTQSFPLHKFALKPGSFNPSDHSLNIDATIKVSGSCTVSQLRTNRTRYEKAPEEVRFKLTATMREIACQEIEGSFNYSRKSQVTVPLANLAAGLAGKLNGDVRFDFADPAILLDIESNIAIPIAAKLELAARQKRVKYAEVKDIPVAFPLPAPGATASKRLRMAKSPETLPGEEAVAADLAKLFSRIPDDMLITADASTLSGQTAVLRIGQNYHVTVSPQVIIPLSLGADTKVSVLDTIALPSTLGAMLGQNTLQLAGEMTNGFPLELAFNMVIIDDKGTALTEAASQTIAAGNTSEVSVTLARLPGADFGKNAFAVLSFAVSGIPESRPFRTEDSIRANLHLRIPGGYHMTL